MPIKLRKNEFQSTISRELARVKGNHTIEQHNKVQILTNQSRQAMGYQLWVFNRVLEVAVVSDSLNTPKR